MQNQSSVAPGGFTVDTIPFVARSGLQVLEQRRGYAKCVMPIQGNGNHVSIMYAGALATLAEFPLGIVYAHTFDVTQVFPIVKDIAVKFVRPAMSDVTVEMTIPELEIQRIEKAVADQGKADFEIQTELKDASGQVVAQGLTTYQLRKMPRI